MSNKVQKMVVGMIVGFLLILLAPLFSFAWNSFLLSSSGSIDTNEYLLSINLCAASFRLIGFTIVACIFAYYLVYGRKEIKKEAEEFEEEMRRVAEEKEAAGRALKADGEESEH